MNFGAFTLRDLFIRNVELIKIYTDIPEPEKLKFGLFLELRILHKRCSPYIQIYSWLILKIVLGMADVLSHQHGAGFIVPAGMLTAPAPLC